MPTPSVPARRTDVRPRLWPGLVILLLQWTVRFGLPRVFPDYTAYRGDGGVAGWLALVVWWLFFSRASKPTGILRSR